LRASTGAVQKICTAGRESAMSSSTSPGLQFASTTSGEALVAAIEYIRRIAALLATSDVVWEVIASGWCSVSLRRSLLSSVASSRAASLTPSVVLPAATAPLMTTRADGCTAAR
jgi:hypothetical protein